MNSKFALPFNLDDIGDSDAHYWVASEFGSNRTLAKGNDRASVVRDARDVLISQAAQREQADLAQG